MEGISNFLALVLRYNTEISDSIQYDGGDGSFTCGAHTSGTILVLCGNCKQYCEMIFFFCNLSKKAL